MATQAAGPAELPTDLSDEQVVERVLSGDTSAYEVLMRRYNQRLYRVARAILRDDTEAEDVIQDAYVRAYQHLGQFEGRAKFSTWLTRIAVHEALARRARRGRFSELDAQPEGGRMNVVSMTRNPEQQAANTELRVLLEDAIGQLPESYRSVFVLREIEHMSTTEVAACLELSEENVKVRLHRARAMLRESLYARVGSSGPEAFSFLATRCDRVVRYVLARLEAAPIRT